LGRPAGVGLTRPPRLPTRCRIRYPNASALPEDEKVRLQGYITACYGSLTSFNILFADEQGQFRGAGGE